MGLSAEQYEDRIRAKLGDLGVLQLIGAEPLPIHLESALRQFSIDRPRVSEQTFDGDGAAYDFDLTADADADAWVPGWSRVIEVEYPAGEREQAAYILDEADWDLVRAGTTGDGVVRLESITPDTGTDNVAIRYTTMWPHPTADAATDEIPDAYGDAVAALAASKAIRAKAIEAARKQSATVRGERFDLDPEALFKAAAEAAKEYSDIVLGRPDGPSAPPQIAYATTELDVFPDAIFH